MDILIDAFKNIPAALVRQHSLAQPYIIRQRLSIESASHLYPIFGWDLNAK